jgi:PIN domain nuclease of toxin-antitoxin system
LNLLLDTHVWIWSQECPEKIGPRTTAALLDEGNSIFLSTASTLEMSRMVALGRLTITMDLRAWVERSSRSMGAVTFPISHEIAIEAYRLPEPFQKDPADRLLVALARIHDAHLVTVDEPILGYRHARTLDARR